MGFFNWGKKEAPRVRPEVSKPPAQKANRIGEDTIPYRPFRGPEVLKPVSPDETQPPRVLGPEDTQPIRPLAEQSAREEELVEAELIPDEAVTIPVDLKPIYENAVRARDREKEKMELQQLVDAINKEYPDGFYYKKEWDTEGNILDMTVKPWRVEKIYPVERTRADGRHDVVHRIVVSEIGTGNQDGFFLGDFFANRLIKNEDMEKGS